MLISTTREPTPIFEEQLFCDKSGFSHTYCGNSPDFQKIHKKLEAQNSTQNKQVGGGRKYFHLANVFIFPNVAFEN